MTHAVRTRRRRAYSLIAASSLVVGAFVATTGTAGAAPPTDRPPVKGKVKGGSDNPAHPLKIAQKKEAQKKVALERKLKGDKAAQGKTVKVGKGQYVNLENEGTDKIFVVLVEFGDNQYPDPRFQGPPPDGSTTDVTGPLHNEIPKPDRSVDNSTLWQPNYDRAHYQDMYFNRMKKYYETQSSGRYSIDGTVTEWVKVPFNEALYGRNYCGSITCPSSKALVRDALAMWVDNQLKSGQTMAQITAYLKTFDQQDRYDVDGDGNFNEPDGFIDHFQVVHAGGDEAAGDPHQGTDAIWSHRWYANLQAGGPNGQVGVNVGSNAGFVSSPLVPNNPTGVWVGDYTVQPENGGLGVFAHEYAHDLGLPDLYDTSGNTPTGAENNTAFWTLMSSGANIGDGGPDGIGDDPTDMGVWELFQLGWLNAQGDKGPFYEVARAGEKSNHKLGPNVPATKSPQAVFVTLPDKVIPLELGPPAEGDSFFWSTRGNDLNTSMTASVSGTALTAQVRYDIEQDWDYAFLEASTNGTTWTPVMTNRSDRPGHDGAHNQSGFNDSGAGITGTTDGAWVPLTATLPAGTTQVRFRYQTDPAEVRDGFMVDAVAVDGTPVADSAWTLDGFVESNGSEDQKFFNAYVLENRQYDGYDTSLRTAYNFGFLGTNRPDWVETYPYQNGLLISYWDSSQTDNNVGDHPGQGLILPVDAHPQFSHWKDGTLMRNRILSYDSTFGTEPTDAITLHKEGVPATIASKPAVPTFDDTKTWWYNCDADACTGSHAGRYQPGWYSVDVPKTGTTVTVKGKGNGGHLNVQVAPKK
ncbi:immune inhibitor A domain-containing protein [Knoellia koreensis]|uniref:M6 family metalloprotease domain-containing protein n=1 Tax=Knoellia koreensis TaxID=2730921 RepID=A0A849HDB1_9MICO|nr:immune inhibitor A domain-containing protein [Knoellia sp. DB2414S]NNM44644.1 M6 family metalloprotease domain-containing protein [Knoellia sp. DB2414S]